MFYHKPEIRFGLFDKNRSHQPALDFLGPAFFTPAMALGHFLLNGWK